MYEVGAGFTVVKNESGKSTVHKTSTSTKGGGGITFDGQKYIILEDRKKIDIGNFAGLAIVSGMLVMFNLLRK